LGFSERDGPRPETAPDEPPSPSLIYKLTDGRRPGCGIAFGMVRAALRSEESLDDHDHPIGEGGGLVCHQQR